MELSTWLARITCDLVENTIQDHRLHKLEAKIREVLWSQGKVSLRDLCRKCRAYSGNNVRALLKVMASKNILEVCEEVGTTGRPSEWVKLKVVDVGK
jgi:response regulator of citrate/malate metabolism